MSRLFVKHPILSATSAQPLRDEVCEFVIEEIYAALDNIAIKCAASVPNYNADYCAETEIDMSEDVAELADVVAYQLLMDHPSRETIGY